MSFESLVKFKDSFKIRNNIKSKQLKSIVQFPENSKLGLKDLNPMGWFSKKEPEVIKDKNETKINIIKRIDDFPKLLMREGR